MRPTNETMAQTAAPDRVIPALSAVERGSERAVYRGVRALAGESAEVERFCERLRSRVAAGRMSYGEQWRDRDNLSEAIDELCDFVAYLLFEGVRRGVGEHSSGAGAELGLIAEEAARLVVRLRWAERELEEAEGARAVSCP